MKIGGGVSTVRQYLQAGLVDELHFAIAPVVLGRGEAMFAGLDLTALGFRAVEHVTTPAATHVRRARSPAARIADAPNDATSRRGCRSDPAHAGGPVTPVAGAQPQAGHPDGNIH